MKYEIKSWLTNKVMLTVEIEGNPTDPATILRGRAVLAAVKQRADLQRADLRGAYLQDADLQDADLQDADLRGAYLRDADLRGAYLRGAYLQRADLRGAYLQGYSETTKKDEIESMVAQIVRTYDGYYFFGFRLSDGTLRIVAGCRYFTPEEYRAHIAEEYPSGTKAEETLAILDFIEARAAKLAPIAKAAT